MPDPALEPAAASALCLLAVPSSLCSSAADQRERYAARSAGSNSSRDGRYRPDAHVLSTALKVRFPQRKMPSHKMAI